MRGVGDDSALVSLDRLVEVTLGLMNQAKHGLAFGFIGVVRERLGDEGARLLTEALKMARPGKT